MEFEIWIAFVITSSVMLAIPGPTVLLVISYALGQGRKTALATVPGVALGDLTAMSVSLLGAGAILATSATLFTAMKLVGAAYLVWLGVKLWRAGGKLGRFTAPSTPESMMILFRTSYVVTALNPKGVVFFAAFVPQFVSNSAPIFPQMVILTVTFVTLATVNTAIWAVAAGTLRRRFQQPGTLRVINRIGGSFLIAAGALTASIRSGT